ncbi:MAG: hypothetical protein IJY76_05945 [Anaerotignum sp.]|nr:hypothetical protein [Anaerotignum sp.]
MKVDQYVMAYRVEQDRLRAMLPDGFTSLRPVLRINAELRTGEKETLYLEYNTPVEGFGKRGWLNIARWESPTTEISYTKHEKSTTFHLPFLEITYTGVGLVGGCPAEKDNDGCFYGDAFVPAEKSMGRKNTVTVPSVGNLQKTMPMASVRMENPFQRFLWNRSINTSNWN